LDISSITILNSKTMGTYNGHAGICTQFILSSIQKASRNCI